MATAISKRLLQSYDDLKNRTTTFLKKNPVPAVWANQQFQQKVAQPIASGLKSAGQAYVNAIPAATRLSPPGQLINSYQNFRNNTNPMQNLQTQGMNLAKAAPLVFGAAGGVNMARQGVMGAAKTILPNALLGGGISKFTGGSFLQGVGQGVGAAPQIAGVTQFSNPLINRAVGKVTGNIQNPLINTLAGRAATGALNIPEGAVINSALGRPSYGLGEAGLDFATGALFGSGKKANAKGFDVGRNKYSRWMKDDVYKVEEVADTLYQNKKLTPELIDKLDKEVTYLARAYLPTSTIEKIANDYGSNSRGFIKATVDELQKSLKNFEDRTGAFTMGIAGNQPLRKSRPGSYTNVPEIDNPLVNKKGFEQEMDELAKQTKVDLTNIKPKKVVFQDKAVKVPSDSDTINTASLRGGSAGQTAEDVKDAFGEWVNGRKASKIEGIVKGREFADLNERGLQGIFDFQRGDIQGNRLGFDTRFRDLKKYFDTKFKALKDAGIEMNYRKDYLPQLWANKPEEVEQTFRRLGLKPAFTIEAVFESYQQGIQAGLTPKFQNIGDLVSWYEQRANKAVADRKFFEFLGGQGMILPRKEAPTDWVTLDPDRFPNITMKTDLGLFTGDYKAPPGIGQMINNYLGGNEDQAIGKVANIFSNIKNRVLSAGIPYTGWNAHGHNILVRNTLANKNPLAGFVQGAYWLTRPQAAEKFINENLAKSAVATKYGMKFDVEDHVFKRLAEEPTSFFGQIDKVRADRYAKWFEDPLFQKALPAMKLSYFNQLFEDFKKTMPENVAGKRAANVANDMFGGINWEQWGRNRNAQNVFRSLILAPDWLESSVRIGKGMLDIKNPSGKAYRTFARNFSLAFVGANILNKHLSGHWLWENEPGNEFNLDTGTYTQDGKKRYVRVFGTAADMIRIPLEAAAGLAKGDPSKVFQSIRNRLSIPISTTMNLVQNQNYLGQPLYGKDKYGNELTPVQSAGGIAGELTPLVAPTQLRSFIDLVSGRNNMEQTVAQALELPIRYKGVFLSPSDKKLEDIAKREGLRGQSLNEFQKKVKDEQTPLGEKQLQKAEVGGTNYINSVIQQREQKRALEDYKEALKNGETEQAGSILEKFLKPDAKAGAAEPTSEEAKILAETQEEMAKASVEFTGKPVQVNDKYIYRTDEGKVETLNLKFTAQPPKSLGIEELDKDRLTEYKKKITSRMKEVGTLLDLEVISREEAVQELNELMKLKNGLSKGSGKGKKFISDAELLSAYKKALEAAYAPPKRTSTRSYQTGITQPLNLKRQEIRSLR